MTKRSWFAGILFFGALIVSLPTRSAEVEEWGEVEVSELAREIFKRFDHKVHGREFERMGLGCPACHQLGGVGEKRLDPSVLDSVFLTPSSLACHFCHNPPEGVEPRGPGYCYNCHEGGVAPESHGPGWLEIHGSNARIGKLGCDRCHKKVFCIGCHVKKDSMSYRVHDRSWLSVHGIAAFADPSNCSTCHLQADCVECHSTSDGRFE